MNMKRARFWRNLLLFSALSGAASLPQTHAQEGVSRVGDGSAGPGSAGVPTPEGFAPLSPSPYMPLDPGYNFPRPMPPGLPPASDTLRNSRRDSFGPRFDIGQFLGDRLGVNDNDTNFNFLLPFLMGSENDVLFIDGRGVATSLGRGAASAGIGFRSYDPTFNRLFGISGWVDYDQGHARTYQQAGISFESLGTWMDVRVNGYIPFGTTSNLVGNSTVAGSLDTRTIGGFSQLSVLQRQLTESAYHGLDAEIGGPLPLLGRYGVSGYVGGYWLDSKTDAVAAGPRVRFEANVTDSMRVSMIASDDPVFGTNAWVNLNLTLPDGRPRRWFRPTEVHDRLLRTAERSYRVQAHTRTDFVPTPVLVAPGGTPNNPQGSFAGQPVRVIFVDPDRLTNGNGTLESPFNTLQGFANVAANTLIVVDGSLSGKTVAGNLTLFGGQKLVSTSILAAGGVQLDTNLGTITVPTPTGFGDASPVSPVFSNPAGGTLVTLGGNRIEVAGITFDGSTSNAAIPNATGIAGANFTDFNIHHNTFRDYSNAVVMSNVRGVGLFQANTLTGTPGVSVDGFRLTNSGVGSLDLFINSFEPPASGSGSSLLASANSFTGNDNAGINITARNRAVINAHIVDNTINKNGQGIILDAAATRSVINASIVSNKIDGNRNGEDRNLNGILDPGEDLNGDGVLNAGNGVLLMANASTLNLAQLGEDVNSNGVLDPSEDTNGNRVLDPSEDTNGNGALDVSEDMNGNGILDAGEDTNGDGLLDTITEDTNGNGILDTGEDTNGDGLITTRLTEDTNRNGVLDLSEDKNGNGTLDASEDTNANGILDGGYLMASNTITGNTGDGVAVQSLNNSIVNMFVVANNFGSPTDHSTGNRGRGLSITANSGTVNANIGFLPNEDTNFNGVLDAGEDTNGNGTLDGGDPLDANNFVANRAGGLFVDLSGTAVGNIVAINNTITGQGSGNLTFTEDLNFNGILDVGEDTNGNLQLDRSFVIAGVNNGTATGNPFSFVNNSQQGNSITGLTWNLASAALEFNTTGANSTVFTPANGTEVVTELSTVNGTLNPFQVTDQATSLDLRFTNFQSTNGVLDVVEDANANGQLDPGEDRPSQFDFNIGTSGAGGAPTLLTGANFIGSQIVATFSSGQVLTGTMQAVAGSLTDSEFVPSANGNNSGSGPGVELRVSQSAVLTSPTFISNNIQFNGGAGFVASATEDGQINGLVLRGNTIQNNGSGAGNEDLNGNNRLDLSEDVNQNGVLDLGVGGIRLSTFAANSAQINGSIVNNTMSNNIGPGISATADSGAIDLSQIDTNIFDGNSTSVILNTLNNGTISTRVTNNTMNTSVNDGFVGNADTGTITLNQFSGNTLNDAGGNGILLAALNGGRIDIPSSEDINGNGTLDGNNSGTLDLGEDVNGNGFLDLGMRDNLLNNPVDNGLFVTGTDGTFNLGTVSGLSVNRVIAGNGGIVIDVTDSVTNGTFIGNSLIGDPTNNPTGGVGFSLTATNGTFNVTIGGPKATDRNVIQRNRGAGIAILAQNNAVGTFGINNNLITGTADDTNATTPFSGQGIYVGTATSSVLTLSTATFNNSTIVDNVIGDAAVATLGNAGGGILVEVGDQSTLNGLTIDNNLIGSNGPAAPAVFAANSANVVNGITFLRTNDAVIDNALITNNQITNNTFNGVYLHALGGAADTLDFTLRGNTITNSAFDGILLWSEADAHINTVIDANQITNNGLNGISTNETVVSDSDAAMHSGVWTKNTISNNGGRGIFLVNTNTNASTLIIGQLGTDPADGLSRGNTIADNGMSGVEVDATGNLEFNNNMIARNGANPTALGVTDANGLGGIDFNRLALSNLRTRLINNIIVNNTGTGIESIASTGQTMSYTMLGNLIDGNTVRGIDLLTRENGNTNARIGDGTAAGANSVSNNGLEAIYIVNTASATQPQTGNVLLANGTINVAPGNSPITLVDIQGNSISGNNNNGTFQSGGLSLLAGSSDLFGNGRLTGRVTNNMFSGNQGLDVLAQTFVANPDEEAPPPVARLDLVFANNFGDALDVNQNNAVYILNDIPFDVSRMRVEQGFNTTGFLNGQPGGSGEFDVPNPWNVVPAGTISNNINNFLFP